MGWGVGYFIPRCGSTGSHIWPTHAEEGWPICRRNLTKLWRVEASTGSLVDSISTVGCVMILDTVTQWSSKTVTLFSYSADSSVNFHWSMCLDPPSSRHTDWMDKVLIRATTQRSVVVWCSMLYCTIVPTVGPTVSTAVPSVEVKHGAVALYVFWHAECGSARGRERMWQVCLPKYCMFGHQQSKALYMWVQGVGQK
jgi:hypothetical protein